MSKMTPVDGRVSRRVTRKRRQVGVTLRHEIVAEVQAMALAQNRTLSNMLEVIVERALEAEKAAA